MLEYMAIHLATMCQYFRKVVITPTGHVQTCVFYLYFLTGFDIVMTYSARR